tara:strand:+ start:231 stop:431 length:201 start_codon:yes stop_codon:yes gene_type:complete
MISKSDNKKDLNKMKDEILNMKKNLLNLNFQKSTGQLENTSQIRKAKKNIAKLKFQMNLMLGDKNA